MEKIRLGDIAVRKIDVGELKLMTYVIQKTNGTICTIVPFIDLAYDEKNASYRGSRFATESKPEIFVHRNEIASICCLNTELTDILCRNPFMEKIVHSSDSNFKEAKIESHILEHE